MQIVNGGQLTPEPMQNRSKIMDDMARMMKQMSERMKMGTTYEI